MKLYKCIQPYKTYFLKVDSIHTLFIEESGNKKGIPIVCLHGGPGYPMKNGYQRFMNPKKFRIIAFHQRGCGKSTPFGSLKRNKTRYLIDDMEKIRKHLKINKWIVEGGSWGATLAVLYSIKHYNRVKGLIVFGLGEFSSKNLMEPSTRIMAPEVYDHWKIKKSEKETMKCYLKNLQSKNKKTREKYMKQWQYEDKLFKLMKFPSILSKKEQNKKRKTKTKSDKEKEYTLALMECYYYMNHAFISDDYIDKNAYKLNKIPGFIIHGRYDMICSASNAYKLSKKWKRANLCINNMAGHNVYDKTNAISLLKAYRSF